jgi:hypothetical protein
MAGITKKSGRDKVLIAAKESLVSPKVKKLSKAGEWALAHPNGLTVNYIDWKAVVK